jgi:redox-sensing transcriptional repressor
MVQGGITAIWNFAPVELQVPENTIVENTPFSQSLAVLSHKLKENIKRN